MFNIHTFGTWTKNQNQIFEILNLWIIYRKTQVFNNAFILLQITDPDCYMLVTNDEVLSTIPKYTTTPSAFKRRTSDKPDFV